MWRFSSMAIFTMIMMAFAGHSDAAPATSTCPDTILVTEYRSIRTITVTQVSLYTPSKPSTDEKALETTTIEHIFVSNATTIDPAACPDATVRTTTVLQTPGVLTTAPYLNSTGSTTQTLSAIATSGVSNDTSNGISSSFSNTVFSTASSTNGASNITTAAFSTTHGSLSSVISSSSDTSTFLGQNITAASSSAANVTSFSLSSLNTPISTAPSSNDASNITAAAAPSSSTTDGSLSSVTNSSSDTSTSLSVNMTAASSNAANVTSFSSSSRNTPISITQWTNGSSMTRSSSPSAGNDSMSGQATSTFGASEISPSQSATTSFGLSTSTSASSTSGIPPLTGSSDSGLTYSGVLTSATLSPSFWLQPTPTIQVVKGGSLDLPCVTLTKNATLSYPDYTTSLCKPHCGSINFQSKTTVKIPPITTDTLCWMPITADSAGVITAAYQLPTTTSEIESPAGMSACPAVHRNTDDSKKCGPDNHYTCPKKECCGKSGKCGKGADFCGHDCRPDWGYCWANSTSCTMPTFAEDDDDNNLIPLYPVLYTDFPKPKEWTLGPWPPVFKIEFANFKYDCLLCDPIKSMINKIWGIKGIECGLLGCDGFDMGWFLHRLPKIGCPNLLRWVCHHILKCCCCGAGSSSTDQEPECNSLICDDTPEVGLNNNGKLCDESLDKCDEPSQESSTSLASISTSSSSECATTSTVTDQTILCGLVTGPDGFSSQDCTATKTSKRTGCSVTPKTTSVTTADCQTMTATLATADCQVHTAVNETASTACTSTRTTVVSGCTVSDHTTSKFTTSCPTATATHISVSCGVITGANSTMTSCSQTQQNFETGCDVTGTTTSMYNTACSTTATVTNQDVNCFAFNGTVNGSVAPGSTTCTATTMSVVSGCDVSATTTTSVSISELNVCLVGATGDIVIEPYTHMQSSTYYASNTIIS